MLVTFGQSSGAVPPFDPLLLSQRGSLFLTRPVLGHYIATRDALLGTGERNARWMGGGWQSERVRIDSEFSVGRRL